MTTRIVELRKGILKKNDELAAGLRLRFTSAGVLVLNLVSSPGTGKTAFLERTLRELRARGAHAAALVGDLETDNDARRLAASGAPVRQINTHGICHLDAEMIAKHLDGWEEVSLAGLDYLFIENVGNLVCPSSYDLGERIRVALLSVTEGEDKPLKYPRPVQLRRCGGDHQDGYRRAVRLRPRAGPAQHQRNSAGHPHLRDFRQNWRGDGCVAGLPGGAGKTLLRPSAPPSASFRNNSSRRRCKGTVRGGTFQLRSVVLNGLFGFPRATCGCAGTRASGFCPEHNRTAL